jgi:hypothetical protein
MDDRSGSSGPAGAPAAADGTGRRGLRPVLLGGLSALVLAAGGLLLVGGGSEATEAVLPTAPAAVPAAPTSDASPPPVVPAAAAEVRPGRDPFSMPQGAVVAPAVSNGAPDPQTPSAGVQAVPVATRPASSAPSPSTPAPRAAAAHTLALRAVESAGEHPAAVFSLDGTQVRVEVGSSFGSEGWLLLLSLQQEPDGVTWRAVVRASGGEPFDIMIGKHVHLP